jgi:hypothetical protein
MAISAQPIFLTALSALAVGFNAAQAGAAESALAADPMPIALDFQDNPFKSGFVQGFTLTEQQRQDLLVFLEALTDQNLLHTPALSDPGRP